jgi:octaprenyl-diphosphate synthase
MDYLSIIRKPIEQDLEDFKQVFDKVLTRDDGLLGQVLGHIRQRGGKRMRPIMTLLSALNIGEINKSTLHSAVGLELLHTASLVHDDVVDESSERRGQASVNAVYNNKVAVLVGDYLLSSALLSVSYTDNQRIIQYLAQLGCTLSAGEILQLQNISNKEFSEEIYYQVINQKTASLFEACGAMGALSAGANDDEVERARLFGHNIGMIFQIRDDIFDYYDSKDIGKPTGNDMLEGKLTLPAIYALNENTDYWAMHALAHKVKAGTINRDEIAVLVEFTKQKGGIDYARQKMIEIGNDVQAYINQYVKDDLKDAFSAYLEYVIQRNL